MVDRKWELLEEIPVSRINTVNAYTSRLKWKGNTCLSHIIILCNLFVRAVVKCGMQRWGIRRRYSSEVITYYNLRLDFTFRSSTLSASLCFFVGVGDLADGELARRILQRLSGGIDGQVVRRPRCTELPRRFEPSRRSAVLRLLLRSW